MNRYMYELRAVSKSYTQGKKTVQALQNVSLSIEKGDIYGIIGLSGSGKSTLIRCLSRLVTPSSGTIFFQGNDMADLNKKALRDFRKTVGMIFQHFNLLSSRTVTQNIAYPLEIVGVDKEKRLKKVHELLDLVGLKEKQGAYPSQLSGGEKQRVAIARALASNPDVLLCDEATSALDPKTTRDILNLLHMIHKKLGLTIILITHEMEVVKQICNKLAVIESGRLIEEGLVSDIFVDPKHPTTQRFLQSASHDIPPEFFKLLSPHRKLLKLKFKGKAASQPIISALVRKFNVDANILLGWIDRLQTFTLGILIIELTGAPQGIEEALNYLSENSVHYEVLDHAL